MSVRFVGHLKRAGGTMVAFADMKTACGSTVRACTIQLRNARDAVALSFFSGTFMNRQIRVLQRASYAAVVALRIAIAAAIVATPGFTHAQQKYPSKPIRLIVPFSPGGTSDFLARTIIARMSESLGQPLVIETRTGAGGTIGAAIAAKATPDGYTLLISSAAFTITAAMQKNLPYDPLKDFCGITRLGFSTTALIVPPALGVRTTKDFIALALEKPGQIIFSSAGFGSSTHLNGERFRLAAGIKVKHVGYKGASDAMVEVMAGRAQYAIVSLQSSLASIKDGRLVALAVGTPQRSSLLPDVPTIAETLPGYARDGSHALLAPAGTPRAILNQISQEVRRVFELPEVKERLGNFDFVAAPTTPEEHDRILRADIATFSGVVRVAGLVAR
jgi:tripartite-type tricarboxylate transporter receptor subunit TctC